MLITKSPERNVYLCGLVKSSKILMLQLFSWVNINICPCIKYQQLVYAPVNINGINSTLLSWHVVENVMNTL